MCFQLDQIIAVLTERWLPPDIMDEETCLHNVTLFANDRVLKTGDGVAINRGNRIMLVFFQCERDRVVD